MVIPVFSQNWYTEFERVKTALNFYVCYSEWNDYGPNAAGSCCSFYILIAIIWGPIKELHTLHGGWIVGKLKKIKQINANGEMMAIRWSRLMRWGVYLENIIFYLPRFAKLYSIKRYFQFLMTRNTDPPFLR